MNWVWFVAGIVFTIIMLVAAIVFWPYEKSNCNSKKWVMDTEFMEQAEKARRDLENSSNDTVV